MNQNPFVQRFAKVSALLVAVTVLLFGSSTLRAAVIYSQNWDTPNTLAGNGDALGVYSWAIHRGQNGARGFVGNWPSDPVNGTSSQARIVDDTASPPSGTDRFFGFWNADTQEDMVMWTNSFSGFTLSAQTSASIDWFQRNTNDSGGASQPGTRAAVAVDTGSDIRWFASSPLETNSTAAWTQEVSDLLAPIWIEFDFDGTQTTDDPGGFDVAGIAGALPAGNIVAAGLYLEYEANGTSGDAIRIDSFRLNALAAPLAAVPEPASIALWLLVGAAAIGLGFRRCLR